MEAVLFDMDGVIVDTEQTVTAFWQQIAGQYQTRLSEEDLQRHVYGRPADATLDALFPRLSAAERQAVHAAMRQHEVHDVYREVPGAVAFVRRLKELAIPTALVTSGEPYKVEAIVRQLGLADLFAARVTARNIRRGKPDPQCYRLAAEQLEVAPQRCLVFEDAVSGVQAAVAAGMRCVGIAKPGREAALVTAGARYTIPDFRRVELRVARDIAQLQLGADAVLQLRLGMR